MPDNCSYIFIKDLKLEMFAGIYDHERENPQPVVINLKAEVTDRNWRSATYDDVICYKTVTEDIQRLADSQHYDLLESFGEIIIETLFSNHAVETIELQIEKTKALADTEAVGLFLFRARS